MASLGNIVVVAERLLDKLGNGAPELIEARALAHAEEGYPEDAAYWRRVAKAIRYLLLQDPGYAQAERSSRPIQAPDEVFRQAFLRAPDACLLLQPNRVILGVNAAFEALSWRTASDLVGGDLFAIFPDNPSNREATSEARLRQSLLRVLETGKPDHLSVFRYDVIDKEGHFEERWWDTVNTPLFDIAGRVELILHRTREVTELVRRGYGTAPPLSAA